MKLIGLPGNEVPKGLQAGELRTPDGVTLRYALSTGTGSGRGTVCIFPGRADFIERYFETINDLTARGYAVAILDWRGQGGSQRQLRNRWRGHISSFKQFDRDFEAFMNDVVLPDCPPPYFALAHSTGGQILLRSIAKHTWFDKVVMSSPFVGLAKRIWPDVVIRGAAALAVATGLGRMFVFGQAHRPLRASDFPGNKLTSDIARFTRDTRTLEAAPELGLGGPTFGWLHAAINSMKTLSKLTKVEKLNTPVLFVTAGSDTMVSTLAAISFAKRVPGISVVKVENARHELLNERDQFREQFWAAFDSFIEPEATRTKILDPTLARVMSGLRA